MQALLGLHHKEQPRGKPRACSFGHLLEQQMKQKNTDADGDGTVRNVKGRPVKVPDVEIEEIGHLSESDSIDQVADGSAEDHGKSTSQIGKRRRRFKVKPQDQAHCQKG
jgi:hypothetical protein